MLVRDRIYFSVNTPSYKSLGKAAAFFDKVINTFIAIILRLFYPFASDYEFSIRESVEHFKGVSTFLIAISFGLLVSALISVAVKVTCVSNDGDCYLIISDNGIFLVFCVLFVLLIAHYVRLYHAIRNVELSGAGYDGDSQISFEVKYVNYLEASYLFFDVYRTAVRRRIVLLAVFVFLVFMIGNEFNVFEFHLYKPNFMMFIIGLVFVFVMVFIVELPVLYMYCLLVLFFDDTEKNYQLMDTLRF